MELIDVSKGDLEQLDATECMELVATTLVGRVAVNGERSPSVFPVSYALDGNAITFRAREEVRRQLTEAPFVTFEADGVDPDRNMAWSVMIRGAAEEMRDPGTIEVPLDFINEPGNEPWGTGPRPYWIRIVAEDISGTASAPRVIYLD